MKKDFKTKNKGFTLIELLAVIVILAVIALIAVPQILNILNRARKSAAEDSVSGIAKSAETYVTNFMLQNSGGFPDEELTFNCTSSGCSLSSTLTGYNTDNLTTLDFKGTKPTSGTVKITDNGKKVTASNLNINGFTCNYDGEKASCGDVGEVVEATKFGGTVIKQEDFAANNITGGYEGVLAIVYLDPTDLSATCNEKNSVSTTGTSTGCMKWYVYKDDGTNYTMILDHDIVAQAWYKYTTRDNTQGPLTALGELKKATTETATWASKLVAPGTYTANWADSNGVNQTYTINYADYGNRARLISVEEIYEIIGKGTKDLNSISSGYMDTNCNGYGECNPGENKYAWLFDNTQNCMYAGGCNVESSSGNIGYWTSSAYAGDSYNAWVVAYYGLLSTSTVDSVDDCGLRPVITVKKSDLLQ